MPPFHRGSPPLFSIEATSHKHKTAKSWPHKCSAFKNELNSSNRGTRSAQVYAWGDNDHGQQGNGNTTVNRKPALVHGLEGVKVTRVACGSSHSVAWTTSETARVQGHDPVLFAVAKDPLGACALG